jgi:hypothetical protein
MNFSIWIFILRNQLIGELYVCDAIIEKARKAIVPSNKLIMSIIS